MFYCSSVFSMSEKGEGPEVKEVYGHIFTLLWDLVSLCSISTRKCLLPTEGDLKLFDYYTQSNCQLECLWTKAYEICGCKPWHVPTLNGEKTCFYLGNICFQNVVRKYQKTGGPTCDCPDNCIGNEYILTTVSKAKEHVVGWCAIHNLQEDCSGYLGRHLRIN